jgi:hypothetical protein
MDYRLSPESFQRTSRLLPFSQFRKTSPTHRHLRILATILALSIAAVLIAPLPAIATTYQTKFISYVYCMDQNPQINNRGDIVWYINPNNDNYAEEVCLYRNGIIKQLTSDNLWIGLSVNINDKGTIIWSEGKYGNWDVNSEIYYNKDGINTKIVNSNFDWGLQVMGQL